MAESITSAGASYSPFIGFLYVFNLIVGTGALTMPKAFAATGWLLSLVGIFILAFVSYMTVTFTVEAMSVANHCLKRRSDEDQPSTTAPLVGDERSPLLASGDNTARYYEISERVEMGRMATMFYNRRGRLAFYICLIVYLYGDLTIYAAAVAESLMEVSCTYTGVANLTCNTSSPGNESAANETELSDYERCWERVDLDRISVYRVYLAVFTLLLGPFLFFNVQKTKYLQVFTSVNRWLAFGAMMILMAVRISKGKGHGHPQVFNVAGVPTLFGVCVYSFMCHHSLPSLVTPIRNKSYLYRLLGVDYSVILVFYCTVSFLSIYAFSNVQDMITLNFKPDFCAPVSFLLVLQYYLMLFPVFTLSSNFPIIGVTLRNNLKSLFYRENKPYPFFVDRILFPLVTLAPPVIIALATDSVDLLVSITGSYAGAGIQYVIPATLVLCARRAVMTSSGNSPHKSPFRHVAWVWFVIGWAVLCWILVTVYNILY